MAGEPMTIEDVRVTLEECMDEGSFDYKGRPYYFSRFGTHKPYLIWGPYNEATELDTFDQVLDTLVVDGMTLREALQRKLIV